MKQRDVFTVTITCITITYSILFFCSLVCAVNYLTNTGEKMYFMKFFKFQVCKIKKFFSEMLTFFFKCYDTCCYRSTINC